jgi:hypothetical protein
MTLDNIINSGDPREIKRALAVKMFEHGSGRRGAFPKYDTRPASVKI